MAVSIGKISAGTGIEYLTKAVATGADDYYTGHGERPGRWHGTEAAAMGLVGEAAAEDVEQLFGLAENPATDEPLGAPFRVYEPMIDRVERRVAAENADPARAEEIRVEEAIKGERTAVAGFDLTFSPPKSVSVLWGLGDEHTAEVIETAHERAIDAAFDMLASEAFFTRCGRNGVRKEDVHETISVRYQHRTSRAKDPQLHTHCAVLNRVRTVSDGQWRTLDGAAMYAASGWADAVYQATLTAELTDQLGVQWRPHTAAKASEIVGIPDELVSLFSKRRAQIEHALGDDTHANPSEKRRRRQLSVLRTRAKKGAPEDTFDLRARWANEARHATGIRPAGLVAGVTNRDTGTELAPLDEAELVARTIQALEQSRATWTHHQVQTELAAQLGRLHHRHDDADSLTAPTPRYFPNAATELDELRRLATQIVNPDQLVRIDIPAVGTDTGATRTDGISVYDTHLGARRYTTRHVLATEQHLLDAATRPGGPAINLATIDQVTQQRTLTIDQAHAVTTVATSGRAIDLIVGPAGTGKTWTMGALADLWRANRLDVIGLATSQRAAEELAESIGGRAENLANWADKRSRALQNGDPHRINHWTFQPGQLVIIDEAGMTGTFDLAAIEQQTRAVGAKLLLVGDHHQLGSPSTGGMFRLLVDDIGASTLTDVRRFVHQWERTASLQIRTGNTDAITAYTQHGRLHDGNLEQLVAQLVNDWHHDTLNGHDTVIICDTNDQAATTSNHARARLVDAGTVDNHHTIQLADHNPAGKGDLIRTRKNDRELSTGNHTFVKNRDRWTINKVHRNGDLTVTRHQAHGTIRLPAHYVTKHCELGYAGTAHAVQGATVDIGRALVTPDTTTEAFYVAISRGRHENHAYTLTQGFLAEHGGGHTTPEAVIATILTQPGNEHAATTQLRTHTNTNTLHHLHQLRHDATQHHDTPTIATLDHHITQRHHNIANTIRTNPPQWIINHLGTPHHETLDQWNQAATSLAVYRDRWHPASTTPLKDTYPPAATNDRHAALRSIAELQRAEHDTYSAPIPPNRGDGRTM